MDPTKLGFSTFVIVQPYLNKCFFLEERTPERQKYTHKWMISVDSPSYVGSHLSSLSLLMTRFLQAYHITSILNSVEVASTDATVHILAPSAKTDPPFVILGLADKSFVAKIKLSFSGLHAQAGLSLSEQTLIFEHWVDVRYIFHMKLELQLISL